MEYNVFYKEGLVLVVMVKKKSRIESSSFEVKYVLEPIGFFDIYVEAIGNIFNIANDIGPKRGTPILISPEGEKVSARNRDDYRMKLENSELLFNDRVARGIAEKKGYLFFPSGHVEDGVFSRSFAYEDFVEGARRIVQNIDPEAKWDDELYRDVVLGKCSKLEENLAYLGQVSFKCDINAGMPNDFRIVGDLESKHIGGLKGEGKSAFRGLL